MENLFKCYVCEQYFDQYGLELHFVTTHNFDEEENPSTAQSDQMKQHVKTVHEGNKNAHEISKEVILEPRDDTTVRQKPAIAVLKAPDQQVFYITLNGQNDQILQKYMAVCPKGMNQNTLNRILATKILADSRNKGRQVILHQL